jgi:hypothetical protein
LPPGVIFVGHWRAEKGHDSVAHHWVHRALVAVNGFHHPLQHRVQELPGLVRVPVGQQLHRVLEVREENRDVLALPLQGGLRRQDLLGQVLGGGYIGRPEARGCCLRASTCGMRARGAEVGGDRQRRPTVDALTRQGRRALLAELCFGRILMLASPTLHREPRSYSRFGGRRERNITISRTRRSVRTTN